MKVETQISEKLWSKYFTLTFFYALGTMTANNMLLTGLPLYALHLGGDNSISGLLFGFFSLFAILVRPYFGKLLDEKGRRLVLIIGAVISATISLSYLFVFSIGTLLVLRSFHGIGFSATTNSSGTVISDVLPPTRLTEGIGIFGLANTMSMAIGASLSLFLINQYSFNVLFIVTSAIGFLSLLCAFFIDYEKVEEKSEVKITKPQEEGNWLDSIFEKSALPTASVTLFLYLAAGAIMTFIPTYALSLGIKDIGLYYVGYSFILLFARIASGRLADQYGPNIVVVPGILLIVISFVVLAYATSLFGLVLSGVLYGAGLGTVDPVLNSLMIHFCPPNRRGAGNSTFFTAKDLGGGLGAVIWGYVSLHAGFKTVFLLCAVSAVVGLMAYHFILKKQVDKYKIV